MARKTNFDKDEKLIQAMHLFWQKGYANTSIADLVEYLDINRFSIYNTYGDKQGLYYACLQYYITNVSRPASEVLFEENADLKTLCGFLTRFVEMQKSQQFGCFIQNALVEHANLDKEVNTAGNELFLHLEKGILNCLNNAVHQRQLDENCNINQLTDFILVQLQGIRVMGKAKQYQRLDNCLLQLHAILKRS